MRRTARRTPTPGRGAPQTAARPVRALRVSLLIQVKEDPGASAGTSRAGATLPGGTPAEARPRNPPTETALYSGVSTRARSADVCSLGRVTIPTLLITGPVGVGKTSVAFEMIEVLEEHDVAHAFFDVDGLTYFHPKPADDRFGERFAINALGTLFPQLHAEGVERLILARVLWERDSIARYEEALPGAEITVVRLSAPLSIVEARIRHREIGAGLDWYLARAAELDAHWRANPVEDLLVDTSDRSVRAIAEDVLKQVGWI